MSKTITGTFLNANNTPVANGTLYLKLVQDAVVTGTGQIAPAITLAFPLDSGGTLGAGVTIIASDELTPSGVAYTLTVSANGGGQVYGPEFFVISGVSPINLNNLTPTANSPVVFSTAIISNPTVPQIITGQSLTLTSSAPLISQGNGTFTGNNTHTGAEGFTGNVTVSYLDGSTFVDGSKYTTIDAAIAAVPTFTIANSPTGATETGSTVTITTTAPHGYSAGMIVFVAGVGVNGYNGEWRITSATSTTFQYINCVSPTLLVNCTTGLAASGSGTVQQAAYLTIPSTYLGAEAATCSALDSAGNNFGFMTSNTPQAIHIEDRRGGNSCAYNTGWNSNQLQSNPNDISLWRRDTSPNTTSSNIVTDLQITGIIPGGASLAGGTFEVDTVGNTTTPSGSPFIQAVNGQYAIRSVGGTMTQVMGVAGGGGIDRAYATSNVTQATGLYGFAPKNITNIVTPATVVNSPTGATQSGNTVTITTTATCFFTTGQGVSISGVGVAGYNGSWTVLAPGCNGGSTFTFTAKDFGLAASGNGTVNGYAANMPDAYGVIADAPTVGTRNNYSIFSQTNSVWLDNAGIDVMNASGVLGPTGLKLLRFGGDNALATGGMNQYSTYAGLGVPYKMFPSGHFSWLFGAQVNASEAFEITASTASGGSTFTTPVVKVNSSGVAGGPNLQITGPVLPNAAGGSDLGATALPWGNLWLGTAATNNFKFQPAATAAARVISMPDPLGAVNMPYVIASGTSTLTSNATLAAVTSQAVITTAATNALTTDSIEFSFATAPTAGDNLCHVLAYVTAGNVNFVRTNPTAAAQNVSALVVNWRVIR